MPKYVIEREIPNVGKMTQQELKALSQKSCSVLETLGTSIQWLESYISDNKTFCVYIASGEDLIRQHAEMAGFPVNRISTVRTIIDPITAED